MGIIDFVDPGVRRPWRLPTGNDWYYLKVQQKEFEKLQPTDFSDLMALADC